MICFALSTVFISYQVWLDEGQARLPGTEQEPAFPPQPPTPALLQAFQSGQPYIPKIKKTSLALPLISGNLVLGALQVERPGEPFHKNELELLEVLVGHLSLALVASQRLEIEQWRIEQLTLVRRVSAQIANVFDLDELTRRVTRLIQRTFKIASFFGMNVTLPLENHPAAFVGIIVFTVFVSLIIA